MLPIFLKIRRLTITVLILFLLVSILTSNVYAHSPSSMNLTYDTETQDLKVDITHQVSDPNTHYIFKIVIKKNGMAYNTYNYTNQPITSTFTYTYDVDAQEDDIIEVTANCNQGGQISKQLTVTMGESESGDSSTPGFELFLVIIGVVLLIIWRKTGKN